MPDLSIFPNFVNSSGISSDVNPTPLSSILIQVESTLVPAEVLTVPPGGVFFMAFESKLVMTCSIRRVSHSTSNAPGKFFFYLVAP